MDHADGILTGDMIARIRAAVIRDKIRAAQTSNGLIVVGLALAFTMGVDIVAPGARAVAADFRTRVAHVMAQPPELLFQLPISIARPFPSR